MTVQFSFADCYREIEALSTLAKRFMSQSSQSRLTHLGNQLRLIQDSRRSGRWTVPLDSPLETIDTEGDHDPPTGWPGGLMASLSFCWDIEPVQRPRGAPQTFRIAGIASTLVELHGLDGDEDTLLGAWRMEVAHGEAIPGAYFHIQIGEVGRDLRFFHHHLSVPRLPSYIVTPQAVLAYTLGELFQEEWPAHLARAGAAQAMFAGSQRDMLIRYLTWQLAVVADSGGATPLLALKLAAPNAEIFVS